MLHKKENPMLTITVRPVSTSCNSSCGYCYLGDQTKRQKQTMSNATLEQLISNYQRNRDYCRYVWHGGEPTMAGLDFYELVLQYQISYTNHSTIAIRNSIQTNGYLIDKSWVAFFKKNNFDIGISLDGWDEINNRQRGGKSFERTIRAVQLLQDSGIPFAVICVVTKNNIDAPEELFDFFIRHNINTISFNPIFGEHSDYDINPSCFGEFMKKMYDLWVEKEDPSIHIRFLKESVLGMLGGTVDLCMMQGGCNNHLIIESDGSVFPCHTFEPTTQPLGNIHSETFERLSLHTYFRPIQVKIDARCNACRWYSLCGGDCVRFIGYEDKLFTGTAFCGARKEIFGHIERDLVSRGYINTPHAGAGNRHNISS